MRFLKRLNWIWDTTMGRVTYSIEYVTRLWDGVGAHHLNTTIFNKDFWKIASDRVGEMRLTSLNGIWDKGDSKSKRNMGQMRLTSLNDGTNETHKSKRNMGQMKLTSQNGIWDKWDSKSKRNMGQMRLTSQNGIWDKWDSKSKRNMGQMRLTSLNGIWDKWDSHV